jgi:hypothetical protein
LKEKNRRLRSAKEYNRIENIKGNIIEVRLKVLGL